MQSSDGVEPFDWNEQFQQIQAEYYDDYEKELDRLDRLNAFVEKFTAVATEAGRTIISELFLPEESRTIRSITAKVGGIAGGEKYICRGIFFKFTKDNQGIFGGNDDSAMKAGAHEWRSYLELADCRIPGLHFPFVVVLDYRGYRMLAQTILPIDTSTLVYGSPDGGRTVLSTDPELVRRVKRASKLLNLCSHTVWNGDMTSCAKLYTPIDCEGHLGNDKRFYLLDPARLFPPEPPSQAIKGGRLFRLLRPELLKHIRTPLCSDAFSRFNVENLDSFNADVSAAHAHLVREVIPAFCGWLQERFDPSLTGANSGSISVDSILEVEVQAHRRGINFRYLGLVLCGVASFPSASCVVWTAVVARVIKGIVRSHFRALKSSFEAAFRKLFLTYLNLIFAPLEDKKSQEFWNRHLKDRVEKQFPKACNGVALARNYPTHGRALLDRILMFFGCKLADDAAKAKISGAVCAAASPFEDRDLTEFAPITRTSNRISLQNATAVAKKALNSTSDSLESRRLLREAEENFKSALQLKPDDIRAIQNWALSLALHAGRLERVGVNEPETESLYASAIDKLRSAVDIDSKDARTHTIWANLLYEMASNSARIRALRIKLLGEAAEHYSIALTLNQANTGHPLAIGAQIHDTLFNWGQCLLLHSELVSNQASSIKLLESACSKLSQATDAMDSRSVSPKMAVDIEVTKQTLAVATAKLGWKSERIDVLERAISLFRSCLESLSGNLVTNFNCANALFKLARLRVAAALCVAAASEAASDAAERYITCLDIQPDFLPALYNWGALVLFQATALFAGDSHSPEFDFAARMFFQIFIKIALPHSDTTKKSSMNVKLECLMALASQDKNQAVASMAIRTLNSLTISKNASESMSKSSESFLQSIFSRPNGSSLRADSLRALEGLPPETSSILNTLGSSSKTLVSDEATNAAITMRDVDVIASLSLGTSTAKPVGISGLYKVCLKRPGRPHYLMSCMSVDAAMATLRRDETESRLSAQQLISQHLELVSRSPASSLCPLVHYFMSSAVVDDSLHGSVIASPTLVYCLFNTSSSSRGLLFNRLRSPNLTASGLALAVRWYAAQIYSDLKNLHSKGLVLKHVLDPVCLYMESDGYAVDLGLPSQQSAVPTDSDIAAIPSQFIAPEVLLGRTAYTPAADWFIFGWFLYYLSSRLSMPSFVRPRAQFDGIYHSVLVDQVTRIAESKMPDPSLVPLIQGLLQRDPIKRCSVAESLPEHPFFAGLDWGAIGRKTAEAPFKPDPNGLEEVGTDATIMGGPIQAEFRGNSFVEM